jgi:DNA-binding NarL/FixJ family response regulator
MGGPRVLVVDPDPVSRSAIVMALTEAGCDVTAGLRSGVGAAYAVRTQRPAVLVTELALPPGGTWSGLQLIAGIAKEAPGLRVLVVTGPRAAHLAGRAVAAGACLLLSKEDLGGLVAAVRS